MLILGATKQKVFWPEAGIELELIPLTEDMNQKFIRDTITEERDDKGQLVDIKRDPVEYARLVGTHCIKGWSGVVNSDGNVIPCRPDAIAMFMLIEPASAFVMKKVEGLALHIATEIDAGKPGSEPSLNGTEA